MDDGAAWSNSIVTIFQRMKKNGLVLTFLLAGMIFFSACDADPDDTRNLFTGRYEVEEYSQRNLGFRPEYEIQVRKDPGSDHMIIISNFYNMDVEVKAAVEGYLITIAPQTLNFYEFEGDGKLTGSIINLNYTAVSVIDDSDFQDELIASMKLID